MRHNPDRGPRGERKVIHARAFVLGQGPHTIVSLRAAQGCWTEPIHGPLHVQNIIIPDPHPRKFPPPELERIHPVLGKKRAHFHHHIERMQRLVQVHHTDPCSRQCGQQSGIPNPAAVDKNRAFHLGALGEQLHQKDAVLKNAVLP